MSTLRKKKGNGEREGVSEGDREAKGVSEGEEEG